MGRFISDMEYGVLFSNFGLPMVLPKLFIPEVADYQKEPGVYIYRRAIALYLHLNYGAFEAVRCAKEKEVGIDWYDKKLTDFWGKEIIKAPRIICRR